MNSIPTQLGSAFDQYADGLMVESKSTKRQDCKPLSLRLNDAGLFF